MGAGFCNFIRLGWSTQTPLPPSSLQDQRALNSSKVGREDEEGVSSSRPELVSLTECLEDHDDDVSLLYLTDSEAILQAIFCVFLEFQEILVLANSNIVGP